MHRSIYLATLYVQRLVAREGMARHALTGAPEEEATDRHEHPDLVVVVL